MAKDIEQPIKPEVMLPYDKFGIELSDDPFQMLDQKLDIMASVETWDHEHEDRISGLVISIDRRDHGDYGGYDFVVLQVQNGDFRGVAMLGKLMADAAEKLQPGDLLGIRQGEKKMNRAGTLEFNNHNVVIIPKGQHKVGYQAEQPF